MRAYDVAVVGGGLVGTATAYALVRSGTRTVLLDAADAGRATDAGAGILSPETTKNDNSSWTALCRAAGDYYDELVAVVEGTGWARCGILELATRESDVPAFEWLAERARGSTEITPEDARAIVPALGDVVRALWHPGAARVDGRKVNAALRDAALALGLDHREERVDDLAHLDADVTVIAGGAWTPRLASALGVDLPVRPLRGQIVHLDVDDDTASWPIVQPVFGYYMVPWPDARVAVGATVEEAGFDAAVTARGVHEVLRETLRVLPGLSSARLREVRVGLRPASGDDLPIIGALPGHSRVFVVTGHGANGLLLGPVSGHLVADLILGREPCIDPAPFAPARFH